MWKIKCFRLNEYAQIQNKATCSQFINRLLELQFLFVKRKRYSHSDGGYVMNFAMKQRTRFVMISANEHECWQKKLTQECNDESRRKKKKISMQQKPSEKK